MVVYWFEYHPSTDGTPFLHFVTRQLTHAFTGDMLAMLGLFGLIGTLVGIGFAVFHLALTRRDRTMRFLGTELARDIASIVEAGEGESIEFKSSARWDLKRNVVSKELGRAIARTIAGFMNHLGGSLLVGVDDRGNILGIEHDYITLRKQDRDGFQKFIMELVKARLGGSVCRLVHCVFDTIGDKEICRVIVEPSLRPVYMDDSGVAKYIVRTGNVTRELDARESVEHITSRRPLDQTIQTNRRRLRR